ncbi:hypothetical protein AKJ52_00890 [candidate division MSBL1 archaeon SCGC-AAA382C18]|uniref:Uncharacterized protein n=1 Tax=candidate division MSBL1 archaeon SCGC-AAA382C18 TaxID=1698281 RepID=A0A133VL25_9EURY|nr:hypothetical protein AKJ52_00890 [candidate division MSBL1 archaeon SCGC-AAA382C18]
MGKISLDTSNEGGKAKDLRIDELGNRNAVKKLMGKNEPYKPFTAKGAADNLNIGPKTARKHLEDMVGQIVDGGMVEKNYTDGQVVYQKNACLSICKEKKEAKKKCGNDEEWACRSEEILDDMTEYLGCGCENVVSKSSQIKAEDVRMEHS